MARTSVAARHTPDPTYFVIPAQAGIQIKRSAAKWIPACAGMTGLVDVTATLRVIYGPHND